MDLKEFVSQSLQQIIEGVVLAQTAVHGTGARINPPMSSPAADLAKNGMVHTLPSGVATMVDFDVAVTVVEGTGTRAGIGVLGGIVSLGASGESNNQNQSVSRIKFRVPMGLPDSKPVHR